MRPRWFTPDGQEAWRLSDEYQDWLRDLNNPPYPHYDRDDIYSEREDDYPVADGVCPACRGVRRWHEYPVDAATGFCPPVRVACSACGGSGRIQCPHCGSDTCAGRCHPEEA